MLLDRQNEFSTAQLLTVSAISTDQIDTLAGNSFTNLVQNLGGTPGALYLIVQTRGTFAGGTSLQFSLESDSVNTLAASPTVHFISQVFPVAQLTANRTLAVIPLPYGDYEKFLGMRYTIVGTMSGAGSVIQAFLVSDAQVWKAYPVAQASNL